MRRRFEELAGATGLEPAASCVTGSRSNQLNYAPALHLYLFPAVPSDGSSFPSLPFGRAVTGQPRPGTYWISTVLTARTRSSKADLVPGYWTFIGHRHGNL